jgi:hypothetical protein
MGRGLDQRVEAPYGTIPRIARHSCRHWFSNSLALHQYGGRRSRTYSPAPWAPGSGRVQYPCFTQVKNLTDCRAFSAVLVPNRIL